MAMSVAVCVMMAAAVLRAEEVADPLTNGLIFYAPLDGSFEAATAAGAKTPTAQKDLNFVDGKFGKGVELKDKAQLSYSGEKNFNLSEGTIAFWAKRNEKWGCKKGYVLFKGVAGPDWNRSGLYFIATEWDQLRVWIFDDKAKESMVMTPNGIPYPANEWQHMAITFKDGSVKIYANGTETSYGVKCDPMLIMPSGIVKQVQFGSDYDGAKFNGVMDELRIYNRVLVADEIKKLFEYAPSK